MKDRIKCSFCHKKQGEVEKLLAGPDNVYICDNCVYLCYSVLSGNKPHKTKNSKDVKIESINPVEIYNYLEKFVVGQEIAKKALSVAVYKHLKRISSNKKFKKTNICLIGPSGSGKTYMTEIIAKYLDIPVVSVTATSLTESGYVGDDVESIISKLYKAAGKNVEKTQKGIVFLDEIDKKAGRESFSNLSKDVSGIGVQKSLLRLIEGDIVTISEGKNDNKIDIDTRNILFVFSGAFVGLEKIIEKRLDKKSSLGFMADLERDEKSYFEILSKVEPQDLIDFGIIPELVGRISLFVPFEELSREQLVKILKETENSLISQFVELFKEEDINLIFKDKAIDIIADLAKKRKLGARGLLSILEDKLLDVQFRIKEMKKRNISTIIIDSEFVLGQTKEPKYIMDNKEGANNNVSS
jgi:ATP-dependent Clp protease ATP-binding subunit ClpX